MRIDRAAARAARVGLASLILSGLAIGGAKAVGTPALVVDVASGRVLHAENATDPWYPASITKLMTTYVALDLVRQGRASMDTLLTLSPEAAAQPPSKMGFKPGTQITLENALKIIMVKSANDLAMMIGENLGGSVEGYAAMMNDTARRLGMRESRWYNSNGLPDPRQQTSARDMAILARALLRDFPDSEYLFHIGAVQLGRNVMRNHNGMLGRYPGADGMKTGFICSGGFNIVASATQGGRRLITVVMGYPSARERDLRAANLFDEGFSSFGGWGGQQLQDLPPSASMAPPDMRASVCGPHKRQPEADDEVAVVQSRDMGTSDNGITALFAPTALSQPGQAGATPLGRRSLGPRVAFAPIPVFLGPSPGSVPDGAEDLRTDKVQITSRKVRARTVRGAPTNQLSKNQLPSTADAVADLRPTTVGGDTAVNVVKTTARPGSQRALNDNLVARPAADVKPKLGALNGNPGGAKRQGPAHGLGAIPAREKPLPAEAADAPAVKPGSKPTAKVAPRKLPDPPKKTARAKPARQDSAPATAVEE